MHVLQKKIFILSVVLILKIYDQNHNHNFVLCIYILLPMIKTLNTGTSVCAILLIFKHFSIQDAL